MMVTNNPGLPPVNLSAQTAVGAKNNPGLARAGRSYDRFQQTTAWSGHERFQKELAGRISQEVRTSVTTGDIQELRRQVWEGEYAPDPSEIAARILLMGV